MELAGSRQASPGYRGPSAPASRRMLRSLAVLGVGALMIVACAPPNSPAGANDGGVPINTAASAASAAAPIDVALTDTQSLLEELSSRKLLVPVPAAGGGSR